VADGNTYYGDADSDDFGDASVTISACGLPSGYAQNDLDCDDGDPSEPQYVTTTGTSTGAGSYSDPLNSIQTAIDASTVCVLVSNGTYYEDIDFNGRDISVSSVYGAENTTIDGTGAGAVVSFVSGETAAAALTGFTIAGGIGHLSSSTLSSACTSETTCYSYYSDYCGGGVYANGSDPTLTDLVVQDNTLPVSSTTPSGNDTYYVDSFGGGLCFESSNATLSGVDVLRNFAEQGGGLFVDELSAVSASQGWFISNTATDGGSVDVEGSVSLTNIASLFNSATGYCGGAMANGGTLNETNVTHAGDDSVSGGQVCATAASSAAITDTIVYGATGLGVYSSGGSLINLTYNDVYGNTLGNYSGVTDPTGTSGNLSANPLFSAWTDDGNSANDDITLGSGSPAINTGDTSSTMFDPDGSRNDMGAYGGPGGSWN